MEIYIFLNKNVVTSVFTIRSIKYKRLKYYINIFFA